MSQISRREFAKLAGAGGIGAWASTAWSPFAIAQGAAKVVIVGGGAGGATVAHYVKKDAPELDVTLIEVNPIYSSSFFSNLYHRRLPHAGIAQSRLRRPAAGWASRWCTTSPPTSIPPRRPSRPGAAAPIPTTGSCCRRASTSSTTPSRATRARPRASCRTPTRRRRAGKRQLKQQLAGHARRRHGGDGDAQQSLSLPARAPMSAPA